MSLNGEDLPCYSNKVESVGYENVHMNIDLLKSHNTVANISKSFTYNTEAKISRHRYKSDLKSLLHCYPMYNALFFSASRSRTGSMDILHCFFLNSIYS